MRNKLSLLFFLTVVIFLGAGCQADTPIPATQVPSPTPTEPTFTSTPSPAPSRVPDNPLATETSVPTNIVPLTLTSTPEVTSTPDQPLTSEATASPTETTIDTPCLDEAAYISDVTIPDDTLFEAGEAMSKVWQVKNTGTCTWDAGYSLVYAKGDVMDGPLSNPIPVVAPGEIVEVSVDLVAPSRGGQQTGYWEFQNSHGTRFGVGSGGHDYIWVQIKVNWSSPDDKPDPTVEATPISGKESDSCTAAENSSFENQVLALINSARESAGLSALTLNAQLSAAALEHSRDMACVDFIDHTGSDGSTWYDRVAARGYANYSSARENIYVGDPSYGGSPDGAFTWWMNSQVHRDNILYTSVSEIGIGYVFYSDSSYGGYFTVVFARP
jgi:uncharacterized protein YkwD